MNVRRAPYSGTSSVTSDSVGSRRAIQLAQDAGVNFGDGDVDGDGFLAGLDFLLIAAMAKFAFDFDVSALGQLGGCFRQFAPQHDAVPFGAAVIAAGLVLPAALGSEREIRDGGAVGGLMSFRIGTDEANEIDVILYVEYDHHRAARCQEQ